MSVVTLANKVPGHILYGILKNLGLSFDDIKDVEFTFDPVPPAEGAGSCETMTNRMTRERKVRINIDELQCRPSPDYPKYRHTFYNVLAHELTHLRQILRGHLKPTRNRHTTIWKGEAHYSESFIQQHACSKSEAFGAYQNLPWEKEANEESIRVVDKLIKEGMIKPEPAYVRPSIEDILSKLREFV